MRASNDGEGGILALLGAHPIDQGTRPPASSLVILFGAALLYGDGVVTPAISVLSAVEGLKAVAPALAQLDRADHDRDPRRPLPRAAARHRAASASSSARSWSSGSSTIGALGARSDRCSTPYVSRARSTRSARCVSSTAQRLRRVLRARRGHPLHRRRRGALRRHGPLRPAADRARVVRARLPGARPQLLRARRVPALRRRTPRAVRVLRDRADGRCSSR